MLSSVSAFVLLVAASPSAVVVEGVIADDDGNAVAGARVFVEQGLGGSIRETRSDERGRYRLDGLLTGRTGFFAIAPGRAFGGRTRDLRIDEHVSGFDLTLHPPGSVSGTIRDADGRPVSGAAITRVGLRISKSDITSIPFFKLAPLGFDIPKSDANGKFTISNLPRGKLADLKVGHPAYAQIAKGGVRVGDKRLDIRLAPGVLVVGTVLSRSSETPVPNAPVLFLQNAPTPVNFIAVSQNDGSYAIRLEPGKYFVKAEGATFRTQAPQRILVADSPATQRYVVRVAGMGTINGKVFDARTERPIAGAVLRREAFGIQVAEATTGPSGEYSFDAAAGENSVRLISAPNYLTPDQGYGVLLDAGETKTIPTFWLAPIPEYSLQVFDSLDRPVPDAFVTILRPRQLGWRRTDAEGKVTMDFVQLPADGRVVGVVEHPTMPLAAAFSIPRNQSQRAAVTLLPIAEIVGRVHNDRASPLRGIVVEAVLLGSANEVLTPLWSTATSDDGAYRWPGAIPHTALAIIAYGRDRSGSELRGRSEPFILERTGTREMPPIKIIGGRNQRTIAGDKLRWQEFESIHGAHANEDASGTLLFFSRASNADAAIAMAENAARHLADRKLEAVVVLDEETAVVESGVPVVLGDNPTDMTTYLLDRDDTVLLETTGLPPLVALNNLSRVRE